MSVLLAMRSALVLGVVLGAELASAASAMAQADLQARCRQLVAYYGRYATSRGEDTDGNRSFSRLSAEIDCQNGRYEKGIAALEALLKGKNWSLPPPPRS
jgi:hypothetical protein